MTTKKSEQPKRMTYEEWEQEHLRRLREKKEKERTKAQEAMGRFLEYYKTMEPVQALEKDDKTLILEHLAEKYG